MSKVQEAIARAKNRFDANVAAEATGFFGGSLAIGAFADKLPANIAGIDTKLVLGGLAYFYAMKKRSTKQGGVARGAAYALLGEYVQSLGTQLMGSFGAGAAGG